ncbi:FAD-dependent oxidoreductase [Henriciella barbarensis]|uniref:FAD-dependent oxidoreductase n=1 Tax=Henriciella barbarensis TaxID=86342 RepID=A0A399R294_9PROT|nr:FAD-dependent oxidoreductase [Henriciella barbarensis]RIJ23977.1 FAD-dependent oxidoreductase [Henriciella barbarensis]
MQVIETECCIAGGGPAGIMLGYLLARQGVDVVVVEKHKDFLRDFRGDTVHPSTMQVLHELGLLDTFLKRDFQKTEHIGLNAGGRHYRMVDFSHLPTAAKFIAFMPQWDFLDFLASEARKLPGFQLMMETRAERLMGRDGQVTGICAKKGDEDFKIRAKLTVACDGRDSTLREAGRLKQVQQGVPFDVLWFRLPRNVRDASSESLGHLARGGFLVSINRGSYWQAALVIEKDGFDGIQQDGLAAFRDRVSTIAPELAEEAQSIESFDDVKLLRVEVNRLRKWWRDGLLAIGDAAHAMSPVGGVGINLALQDAVAAARIIGPALKKGSLSNDILEKVQKRREWPAEITQAVQVFAHERVIMPTIRGKSSGDAPFIVRLLDKVPILRRLPARAVGMGPRPEHWPKELDQAGR